MSNDERNNVTVGRKPKVSNAVNRKRVTRPMMNDTILTKKNEIVIKRATQPTASSKTGDQTQQTKQMTQAQTQVSPTAKELKAAAIEKALASTIKKETKVTEKTPWIHFSFKRVLLALACSAVAVFAIVYFVNLNAPNISLKVAAMQTGIEASYPAYVPRDYSLSDITSENGKITLNFKNTSAEGGFSIIEEKSSWDTNALLNNFVREEYGENYVVIKEQGLTIYISNGNAAWVNGGIIYKLKSSTNQLTKKQIKSIAVSL